ncbi:Ig domain-containing protein, partial [Trichostrongylus colubriformis]
MKKKKKKKAIFSVKTKQTIMSVFSLGGMKIENIDIDEKNSYHELVSGISLSLSCNQLQRKNWQNETESTISWYMNSEEIRNQRFEWRVTVAAEGILNIWPLVEEDGGHYECAVDGTIMGSVLINVIPKSEAVVKGLFNYFYVALFYIPVGVYAVILISRDITKPPKKSARADRMAAFLEDHVLKNGQDVK